MNPGEPSRHNVGVGVSGADRRPALRTLTRPGMLGLHLLALVAVTAMTWAGVWQLDVYRSQQHQESQARAAAPPTPLGRVLGPDDAFSASAVSAPVVVQGTYAARSDQFLVAGRTQAGRDGYWVVSPLLVKGVTVAGGGASALLVVRGWQPTAVTPPVPRGPVTVTGALEPGEQRSTPMSAGRVVGSIRIPELVQEVPFDLYSGYVLRTRQAPVTEDGLLPVPPPTSTASWTTGLRNLSYAGQWWLFAAFGAFLWWRTCSEEMARARAHPATGSGAQVA